MIACSAQIDDRESLRRAGMDGFLAKPVDRDRLERLIARLIPAPSSDSAP